MNGHCQLRQRDRSVEVFANVFTGFRDQRIKAGAVTRGLPDQVINQLLRRNGVTSYGTAGEGTKQMIKTDLNRFYRLLLAGDIVTGPLLAAMQRTVAVISFEGKKIEYGLGLHRMEVPGQGTFWGHDGPSGVPEPLP